jgi:glycosyltransferase involved in cell wall biosynthesis
MKAKQSSQENKISIITPELHLNGGLIRSCLIAQALQKLNYQVEIIGYLLENKEIYATPAFDVSIFPVEVKKNNQNLISAAKKIIQKADGEVIYAVKPRTTSFGLSLLKKLTTRRPLVLDIDDWELSWQGGDKWKYRPTIKQFAKDILKKDGALRNPDHPLYLKWMEGLVSRADAITIHTKFLQERFGGVYLPNGKDTSLFDPSKYDPETSRNRYGLSGYRVLMFPGAPRPYKGLEDLLIALEKLNQPDLRLVIVGGSPYDNYDSLLMEKWGHWIIKLPKYPASIMPEIVAGAHIVVVPQRDHPATKAQFPLKLTDGMAMAKPVLSTKVGDIPEILGDTGYLVEPSSPLQLAEKIQWIFENLETAQEQAIKARERCVKNYSIETMASILSDLIAGLTDR